MARIINSVAVLCSLSIIIGFVVVNSNANELDLGDGTAEAQLDSDGIISLIPIDSESSKERPKTKRCWKSCQYGKKIRPTPHPDINGYDWNIGSLRYIDDTERVHSSKAKKQSTIHQLSHVTNDPRFKLDTGNAPENDLKRYMTNNAQVEDQTRVDDSKEDMNDLIINKIKNHLNSNAYSVLALIGKKAQNRQGSSGRDKYGYYCKQPECTGAHCPKAMYKPCTKYENMKSRRIDSIKNYRSKETHSRNREDLRSSHIAVPVEIRYDVTDNQPPAPYVDMGAQLSHQSTKVDASRFTIPSALSVDNMNLRESDGFGEVDNGSESMEYQMHPKQHQTMKYFVESSKPADLRPHVVKPSTENIGFVSSGPSVDNIQLGQIRDPVELEATTETQYSDLNPVLLSHVPIEHYSESKSTLKTGLVMPEQQTNYQQFELGSYGRHDNAVPTKIVPTGSSTSDDLDDSHTTYDDEYTIRADSYFPSDAPSKATVSSSFQDTANLESPNDFGPMEYTVEQQMHPQISKSNAVFDDRQLTTTDHTDTKNMFSQDSWNMQDGYGDTNGPEENLYHEYDVHQMNAGAQYFQPGYRQVEKNINVPILDYEQPKVYVVQHDGAARMTDHTTSRSPNIQKSGSILPPKVIAETGWDTTTNLGHTLYDNARHGSHQNDFEDIYHADDETDEDEYFINIPRMQERDHHNSLKSYENIVQNMYATRPAVSDRVGNSLERPPTQYINNLVKMHAPSSVHPKPSHEKYSYPVVDGHYQVVAPSSGPSPVYGQSTYASKENTASETFNLHGDGPFLEKYVTEPIWRQNDELRTDFHKPDFYRLGNVYNKDLLYKNHVTIQPQKFIDDQSQLNIENNDDASEVNDDVNDRPVGIQQSKMDNYGSYYPPTARTKPLQNLKQTIPADYPISGSENESWNTADDSDIREVTNAYFTSKMYENFDEDNYPSMLTAEAANIESFPETFTGQSGGGILKMPISGPIHSDSESLKMDSAQASYELLLPGSKSNSHQEQSYTDRGSLNLIKSDANVHHDYSQLVTGDTQSFPNKLVTPTFHGSPVQTETVSDVSKDIVGNSMVKDVNCDSPYRSGDHTDKLSTTPNEDCHTRSSITYDSQISDEHLSKSITLEPRSGEIISLKHAVIDDSNNHEMISHQLTERMQGDPKSALLTTEDSNTRMSDDTNHLSHNDRQSSSHEVNAQTYNHESALNERGFVDSEDVIPSPTMENTATSTNERSAQISFPGSYEDYYYTEASVEQELSHNPPNELKNLAVQPQKFEGELVQDTMQIESPKLHEPNQEIQRQDEYFSDPNERSFTDASIPISSHGTFSSGKDQVSSHLKDILGQPVEESLDSDVETGPEQHTTSKSVVSYEDHYYTEASREHNLMISSEKSANSHTIKVVSKENEMSKRIPLFHQLSEPSISKDNIQTSREYARQQLGARGESAHDDSYAQHVQQLSREANDDIEDAMKPDHLILDRVDSTSTTAAGTSSETATEQRDFIIHTRTPSMDSTKSQNEETDELLKLNVPESTILSAEMRHFNSDSQTKVEVGPEIMPDVLTSTDIIPSHSENIMGSPLLDNADSDTASFEDYYHSESPLEHNPIELDGNKVRLLPAKTEHEEHERAESIGTVYSEPLPIVSPGSGKNPDLERLQLQPQNIEGWNSRIKYDNYNPSSDDQLPSNILITRLPHVTSPADNYEYMSTKDFVGDRIGNHRNFHTTNVESHAEKNPTSSYTEYNTAKISDEHNYEPTASEQMELPTLGLISTPNIYTNSKMPVDHKLSPVNKYTVSRPKENQAVKLRDVVEKNNENLFREDDHPPTHVIAAPSEQHTPILYSKRIPYPTEQMRYSDTGDYRTHSLEDYFLDHISESYEDYDYLDSTEGNDRLHTEKDMESIKKVFLGNKRLESGQDKLQQSISMFTEPEERYVEHDPNIPADFKESSTCTYDSQAERAQEHFHTDQSIADSDSKSIVTIQEIPSASEEEYYYSTETNTPLNEEQNFEFVATPSVSIGHKPPSDSQKIESEFFYPMFTKSKEQSKRQHQHVSETETNATLARVENIDSNPVSRDNESHTNTLTPRQSHFTSAPTQNQCLHSEDVVLEPSAKKTDDIDYGFEAYTGQVPVTTRRDPTTKYSRLTDGDAPTQRATQREVGDDSLEQISGQLLSTSSSTFNEDVENESQSRIFSYESDELPRTHDQQFLYNPNMETFRHSVGDHLIHSEEIISEPSLERLESHENDERVDAQFTGLLESTVRHVVQQFVYGKGSSKPSTESAQLDSDFVAAANMKQSPLDIDLAILRKIFGAPVVRNMISLAVRNMFRSSGIANARFIEKVSGKVIESMLNKILQDFGSSPNDPITVEEHKLVNGEWIVENVTLPPGPSASKKSVFESRGIGEIISQLVHNIMKELVGSPQEIVTASNPVIENVLVATVNEFLKSNGLTQHSIEDIAVRSFVRRAVDQAFSAINNNDQMIGNSIGMQSSASVTAQSRDNTCANKRAEIVRETSHNLGIIKYNDGYSNEALASDIVITDETSDTTDESFDTEKTNNYEAGTKEFMPSTAKIALNEDHSQEVSLEKEILTSNNDEYTNIQMREPGDAGKNSKDLVVESEIQPIKYFSPNDRILEYIKTHSSNHQQEEHVSFPNENIASLDDVVQFKHKPVNIEGHWADAHEQIARDIPEESAPYIIQKSHSSAEALSPAQPVLSSAIQGESDVNSHHKTDDNVEQCPHSNLVTASKFSRPSVSPSVPAGGFGYFGRIVPQRSTATDENSITDLINSDLYYIGDGVRLPLVIERLDDGSFALRISDKICKQMLANECPCCVSKGGSIIQEKYSIEPNEESTPHDSYNFHDHGLAVVSHEQESDGPRDEGSQWTDAMEQNHSDFHGRRKTRSTIMPLETFTEKYHLNLDVLRNSKAFQKYKTSHSKDEAVSTRDRNNSVDQSSAKDRNVESHNAITRHGMTENNQNGDLVGKLMEINEMPENERAGVLLTTIENLITTQPTDEFMTINDNVNKLENSQGMDDTKTEHQDNANDDETAAMYGYQRGNPILHRIRFIKEQQQGLTDGCQHRYQQDCDEAITTKTEILKKILYWLQSLVNTKSVSPTS